MHNSNSSTGAVEYKKSYIAYMDIMGFSKMVMGESEYIKTCRDIYDIFDDTVFDIQGKMPKGHSYYMDLREIQMKVMSDSIFLCVDSEIPKALYVLISACIIIQGSLLAREKPILIRGAIVEDDVYCDERIVFGPGFIKAYESERDVARYPRIIVSEEAIAHARRLDNSTSDDLIDYLLHEEEYFRVVNCYPQIKENATDDDLQRMIGYIKESERNETDAKIKEKYKYVIKRFEEEGIISV